MYHCGVLEWAGARIGSEVTVMRARIPDNIRTGQGLRVPQG